MLKSKTVFTNEDEKRLHQRKLRASNQRAHVARRREHIERLGRQVDALAYETSRLEGKRESLSATHWYLNDHRSVKTVHEYLRVFKYGYMTSLDKEAMVQERFLRSIMRDDLRYFHLVGVDKLLYVFRIYCASHSNFSMYFLRCDVVQNDEDGLLACHVHMIVSQRITRTTLSMYFPHILHDEVLVQKLIGRQIDLPTTSIFGFDENGLVASYNASMDFVGAYMRLLADLEAVALLVGGNMYHPSKLQSLA
ncbi:hypothetical protein SPRG_11642 [Saprolegnia parasitica CBS 223.65]|uniref:BZIP domain-containing protein n=1 Tax=Saprolegnia parasitica (strain CBS 223.65) TaxID=695850 RepID=A0A067BYI5_SAPPC|nr:hypothetical protein SPRG_11642 [Saprolegnia parasitica CBS 223.65]KDO23328.1 hypothetical protein SPRG_11642 [Saprolegnia parasitica CBS 223.65]|eukprot:XP_012205980.1 hypothetical protein SPRG_11642 [Saprolegnia parasitica CBS 223.65]